MPIMKLIKIPPMFLPAKKPAGTTFGLDIGSDFLKLVELKDLPQGKQLCRFEIIKIPTSPQKDSRISAVDRTLQALKQAVSLGSKQVREVILSISGPEIIYKEFSLPFMPKQELKKAVTLQLGRTDAALLKNTVVDFNILSTSIDERGIKLVDLMVTIVSNEVIEKYVALVKKAGFKPIGIGLKLFAITECFKPISREQKGNSIALINIGSRKTGMVILKEGDICFVRQVELGGRSITESIAEGLNIDFDQAEELKIKYGIPQDPQEEFEKNIALFMRSVLERFLVEIERFFRYYSQRFSNKRVDKVFLCGGGAGLKNIAKNLSVELGLPVEVYNPLTGIALSETVQKSLPVLNPQLTAALGLAQREVVKKLNLLPARGEVWRKRISGLILERGVFITVAPILVFIFIIGYLVLNNTVSVCQKKIRIAGNRIEQLNDARSKLKASPLIDEKVFLLNRLERRLSWSNILEDISREIIIDNLWLKSLHFIRVVPIDERRQEILKISGSAFSLNLVNDYVSKLSKSSYFSGVVLDNTKELTTDNYKIIDFEISCKLALK
ncbi:MAG: type IV pilus assembly protein PilM [Candidatus Omnitrophota bacterium]